MNTQDKINQYLETFIKPIYAFVLTKTKNLEDAEDLTQDIYMTIIKAFQQKKSVDNYNKYNNFRSKFTISLCICCFLIKT